MPGSDHICSPFALKHDLAIYISPVLEEDSWKVDGLIQHWDDLYLYPVKATACSSFNLEFSSFNLEFSSFNLEFSSFNLEFSRLNLEFSGLNLEFSRLNLEYSTFFLEIYS